MSFEKLRGKIRLKVQFIPMVVVQRGGGIIFILKSSEDPGINGWEIACY